MSFIIGLMLISIIVIVIIFSKTDEKEYGKPVYHSDTDEDSKPEESKPEESKPEESKPEEMTVEEKINSIREQYINSKATNKIFEFLGPEIPCKIVIDYENVYAMYPDGTSKTFMFLTNKIRPFKEVSYHYVNFPDRGVYGDSINRPLRFAEALNIKFGEIYQIEPDITENIVDRSENPYGGGFRVVFHYCTLNKIVMIPNDLEDF